MDRSRIIYAELADMIVGKKLFAPEEAHLAELHDMAPRFAVPILASALAAAAERDDCNIDLIGGHVAEAFNRALKQLFPDQVAARDAKMRAWYKHVQTITLGVVRSVAAPGLNKQTNWTRAQLAARFCTSLFTHAVGEQPILPSDMLWRLLAGSTCASKTSRAMVQRKTTWYGMIVRVAVASTPAGMWQEAHEAMRIQADLVKEVCGQIRIMERLGQLDSGAARCEMSMPERAEDKTDDAGIDDYDLSCKEMLGDVFDDVFNGADEDVDEFAKHLGLADIDVDVLCLEAKHDDMPSTPRTERKKPVVVARLAHKPRSISARPIAKSASTSFTCTLNGHFRVIRRSVSLASPVDATSNTKAARRLMPLSTAYAPAVVVRSLDYSDLLCNESSNALLDETDTWVANPSPMRRVRI